MAGDSAALGGALPGFGEPQPSRNNGDVSGYAAPHSEWAAADVPASGAERDTAGTAAFAPVTDHSGRGSGWQEQADIGGDQSAAPHGARALSGIAPGYGDAWSASRGGGDTAATQWQPPLEPQLLGDAGTAAQAQFAHGDSPTHAAQPPYGGMSFGGGGYGTSPLELSPPSVLEPAAAYGAEAGASVNEWQPGVGPGTGSAAFVEDEMVELDF